MSSMFFFYNYVTPCILLRSNTSVAGSNDKCINSYSVTLEVKQDRNVDPGQTAMVSATG